MTRGHYRPKGHFRRNRRGTALLVVLMILSLVSAVAIGALTESGMEGASSGRTRAAARALYAADAGLEIARLHIAQTPPDGTPIDVDLGNGVRVQSRSRSDSGAQPLKRGDDATGGAGEGYSLNIGTGYSSPVYIVNMTSTIPGGGSAEVEAKIASGGGGAGGY